MIIGVSEYIMLTIMKVIQFVLRKLKTI